MSAESCGILCGMAEPDPTADDRYVTSSQLALELGVHIQTVQRYFREEGLPGRKIGHEWRTTRAAWERWLEGGNAAAVPTLETPSIALETK